MRLDTRWRVTGAELAGLLASLSAFFGKMNAKRRGDVAPAEMQCGLGGLNGCFGQMRLQARRGAATTDFAGLLAGLRTGLCNVCLDTGREATTHFAGLLDWFLGHRLILSSAMP